MSRVAGPASTVVAAAVLLIFCTACAASRSAELPGATPVYIPLYSIGNPPPCATRILGREQSRLTRSQYLNDVIAPVVRARGGNAAVEVTIEPAAVELVTDLDSGTEPTTTLSAPYVSYSPALIDWTDCKPGTRKRK
jgi:hypothetical protein